jgi:hypothetical protein
MSSAKKNLSQGEKRKTKIKGASTMSTQCIHDTEGFKKTAGGFLTSMFSHALTQGLGQIEIWVFPRNQQPQQYFFTAIDDAVTRAYDLCMRGIDVYVGVNPRNGEGGRKENIDYITAFHVEIDYGQAGHKKQSYYTSYDMAYRAIHEFSPAPTLINHSGGGFHCYWLLEPPVAVKEVGIEYLETINRSLSLKLGGDRGTQDISRVLRIPGTCNFKVAEKPREVTVIKNSRPTYGLEDFTDLGIMKEHAAEPLQVEDAEKSTSPSNESNPDAAFDVDHLPVPEKVKFLIKHGNDGTYPSRSEADMAVIHRIFLPQTCFPMIITLRRSVHVFCTILMRCFSEKRTLSTLSRKVLAISSRKIFRNHLCSFL